MANELRISNGATFSGPTGSASIQTVNKFVDSTDAALLLNQTASGTPTTLTFPASTNRIAACISNTGATNDVLVDLEASDGTYPIKVPPGSAVTVFLASGTGEVYIKSSASTTTYDVLTA